MIDKLKVENIDFKLVFTLKCKLERYTQGYAQKDALNFME